MAQFRDMPVARKLRRAMLLTSAAALLLATTVFVGYDWVTERKRMASELGTLAEIVAANSAAAVIFGDASAADDTLRSLRPRADVTLACVYTRNADGLARFAVYEPVRGRSCPETPDQTKDVAFGRDHLYAAYPILSHGDTVGAVYVEQSLDALFARLRLYATSVPFVLALCLLLAYAISAALERIITQPLIGLADTARQISKTKDYSLRAQTYGGDEVGQLIVGFNSMVGEIAARDKALQEARDKLEVRVADRTRELEAENAVRRRAEEALKTKADELEHANSRLEESNLELQQFVYITTHDLQEPLRTIAGFAQLIERRYADVVDDKGREWIDFMVRGAHRMKSLVQDVLEYSRLGAKARPFAKIDCVAVMQDVLQNLDAAIAETGAEVTVGEMPVVLGDKSQLVQLLQNLVANGIKFHGDEPPKVHVEARRNGAVWEFSVRDNGIGIQERYLGKIFEIFKRLHTDEVYPGTGIGLAVCRKVVERHGGKIHAESVPGKGSTFRFTIPVMAEAQPGAAASGV